MDWTSKEKQYDEMLEHTSGAGLMRIKWTEISRWRQTLRSRQRLTVIPLIPISFVLHLQLSHEEQPGCPQLPFLFCTVMIYAFLN